MCTEAEGEYVQSFMIAIKSYEILHIIFVTSVILFTLNLIVGYLVA